MPGPRWNFGDIEITGGNHARSRWAASLPETMPLREDQASFTRTRNRKGMSKEVTAADGDTIPNIELFHGIRLNDRSSGRRVC